ncbi:MAG: hypothetical protein PWQ29_345 [Verrucomicrobiota bacterium]|jgi:HSP20 family protein|nr:hypothetical protein [Verrucomicrobiota bacterium]MDK2962951.1 hypothetical protein [Verrucomicrobiota bacterium]
MTTWPIYKRTRLDPLSGFENLQREMNRLFDGYTGSSAGFPLVNVWANENEAVVTAEIPGVDPKDIEINVLKNLLTIQGERKADDPGEDAVCHRNERVTGRFSRTVRLPFGVENDKVKAKYEKGVLKVTLPRAEATKPKKVQISTD